MQMAPNQSEPRGLVSRLCGGLGGWGMFLFSLALGAVMWTASWIGGHPMLGLAMFGIMAAFGAVFVVGRHTDERWRSIDLRATAFMGIVLGLAVIVAFLWAIAHGRDGQPYAPLGAIAGISYLIAIIYLRWRS